MFYSAAFLLALTWIPAFTPSDGGNDLLIRTRTTSVNQSGGKSSAGRMHHLNVYIKGNQQRREELWEAMGPAPRSTDVVISQCDQKQSIFLNADFRTYFVRPIIDPAEARRKHEADLKSGKIRPVPADPTAGVMKVALDTTDTGERREFDGLTARHIRQVLTQEVSPGSPLRMNTRVERDGWYIDIPYACRDRQPASGAFLFGFSRPPNVGNPRIEVKHTGNAPPIGGVPVIETTITTSGDGWTTTDTVELIEVSRQPLDPGLFEIPKGYRPALPLPNGGFDLRQPDTLLNRLQAWWKSIVNSWPTLWFYTYKARTGVPKP